VGRSTIVRRELRGRAALCGKATGATGDGRIEQQIEEQVVRLDRRPDDAGAEFARCDCEVVTATATADEGGSRKRVLSDPELVAVWRALPDGRYGEMVRLLILTAQRREEIGGLRWDEIEAVGVDAATLLPNASAIRLPPERVKNGCEHLLPLSPQARAIIEARRPEAKGPFVFYNSAPFTGWSECKAALDARIAAESEAIPHFTGHDIRRTVATRMADKLGIMPHIIEAILNHISGHKSGVAGIYNLARYEAEMRSALCAWADYVSALIAMDVNG